MNQFPHRVCINLDRRPERWERMQTEFARHGITGVQRFSAVDGHKVSVPEDWDCPRGTYGCLLSHLRVVREACKLQWPSVLVFEDDVVFDAGFKEKFAAYIANLPADWDMLFFGALHMDDPVPVCGHIYQITRAYSTYAYALNHTVFEAFIESNKRAALPVDTNNLILQSEFKCYCFMPHLAWVESLQSDAQERMSNHWYLQHSLVMRGKEINALVSRTLLVVAYCSKLKNHDTEDNLLYLLRVYARRLPEMAITVVEQSPKATIDPASLPEGVRYMWVPGEGRLNRGVCYNAAVREASAERTMLAFIDSDVYLEELDIRANLAMCRKWHCTTGFDKLIELTDRDTVQLKQDEALWLRWLDTGEYVWKTKTDAFSHCCFFNRQVFADWGGWRQESTDALVLRRSENSGQPLRTFASPSYALRLHQRA